MTIICPDKATSMVPFQQPSQILRSSPAGIPTSRYFHLLPHYVDHSIVMNVSLDTANIKQINISFLDFRVWQYSSFVEHLLSHSISVYLLGLHIL